MPLNVSPDSHFVGALGASLFALDRALAGAGRRDQESGAATVGGASS